MGNASNITIGRTSRAAAGDTERLQWHERASALYEDLRGPSRRLVRRAYGKTFGEPEIEDIYSNAWLGTLRALERKHANLSDEEIRSYVLTAVANHASKEIRRRSRKPVFPLEAAGAVAEEADSIEEKAEASETKAITRDLLSSLPPRRRAVMLLRYGWGLDPGEICGMVEGLSPRAYRKEITRGVDDLTARLRLVEEGRWCEEREPLLKAFASGLATEDQALQAERHIAHCRSCHEFVGKLTGHLHDLGSAVMVPSALDGIDGHSALWEKARDTWDGARDQASGLLGRTESSEAISMAAGARGAGAAGAGVFAKLSGVGAGAKAALACTGGFLAASACVVVGVGPIALPGPPDKALVEKKKRTPKLAEIVDEIRPEAPPQAGGDEPSSTPSPAPDPAPAPPEVAQPAPPPVTEAPSPVLEEDTPPASADLGEESVAQPVGAPPPQTDPASGGGAVAQEFGP